MTTHTLHAGKGKVASASTSTAGASDLQGSKKRLPLSITVSKQKSGPPLASCLLACSELAELEAEAWHLAVLRKGYPEVPLNEVLTEMRPLYELGNSGLLSGFVIAITNPAGRQFQLEFTQEAASHQVSQMVQQLIVDGALQLGDEYHYKLSIANKPSRSTTSKTTGGVTITTSSAPPRYLRHELAPLLDQSTTSELQDGDAAPVFYLKQAFEKAARFARRGGNDHPPVETGGILVGTLASCPQSGEFYVIVVDVLEAQHAESKQFSLEFSSKTWTRMHAILRARQSQPATRTLRFVGQAHGHPFLPQGGAPPCEICWQQKECARHSCFVSVDDVNWTRAVFPRQPWQLCHIFGLNARGEHVNKLFTQRNGQLLERGYRILTEFDLEAATN